MKKKDGISLVIPLKEMNGLAENGKSFLSKISLTNFKFDVLDESRIIIDDDSEIDKITTNKSQFQKRIIFNTCEKKLPSDYYNIKVIFWEFESGMMEFRPKIFKKVNEVVAFTDFIYDYLLKIAPKNVKITKMRYPFIKNWDILLTKEEVRAKYNINHSDFVGFFNFDYRSSYNRKNPEMTLRAFAESIGYENNTKMIIKTFGTESFSEQAKRLNQIVRELNINDKVVFINDYLSRNEMRSIINACDYYISLHRGEGLGLGMLEAMALGKPVIATNYSGNTEFTKENNSLLVDYELVEAKDDFEAYLWVDKWAEPNIETAKKHLVKLYKDPNFASEIGKKAEQFVKEYFSLDNFKAEMKKIFDIDEGAKKAECLFQNERKVYFGAEMKNVLRKILRKKIQSRQCFCSKTICVYNNQENFEKVVANNEHLKSCEIISYDNTNENIAITKRYNDFIEKEIVPISAPNDFWCMFIHQDFGIMEDIDAVLGKLNKRYIYGAIGVKIFKGLFWGKKDGNEKRGFKNELKLAFGRILQGKNDFNFKPKGKRALFQITVDSIDCCCIIIHSSLIKKYNLRFDENLNFHMYAEELCYRAKKDYKIKTKVVQMKCFHMGQGALDEEYQRSVKYLKDKFNIKKIPSTCPN